MSVVPIAEALRRLEDDVRELYELREALETQSARLFSQRATSNARTPRCARTCAMG